MKRILRKNHEAFAESSAGDERILAPITSAVNDDYALLNLNPVAGFIWEQLDTADDEQTLCDALIAEYEIDAETAKTDVTSIIETLVNAGAVEVLEGAH